MRDRERVRQDKAGSGEKLNTVSVVCMKGGLGTNTSQSVRVSCAPYTMPASSILSLSSHCAVTLRIHTQQHLALATQCVSSALI